MDVPRTVYAIRHNITQRIYIGSSKNVDLRIKQHLNALRRGTHHIEDMQKDFNEYGESYTITTLDVINRYADKEKEYIWMNTYQSYVREIGYNYKDKHDFKKYSTFDSTELRQLIKEKGLTHPQVAEKLGISIGQFSYRLYNGKLTVGNIQKLITLLDIKNPGKFFFQNSKVHNSVCDQKGEKTT